jgi:hypothetical protein
MNPSVTQCRYLLSLSDSIVAGLEDEHLALEPQPGTKTAGWLIGHLATTGDFGRRLCGRPPICPVEWRAMFNPGSRPSADRGDYPPMSALVEAFRSVYADLCDAQPNADPKVLAAPNPYAPTQATFPTAGDFVAYLMCGHLGYHLGQLVAWRGATGLGPLQRADTLVA